MDIVELGEIVVKVILVLLWITVGYDLYCKWRDK